MKHHYALKKNISLIKKKVNRKLMFLIFVRISIIAT